MKSSALQVCKIQQFATSADGAVLNMIPSHIHTQSYIRHVSLLTCRMTTPQELLIFNVKINQPSHYFNCSSFIQPVRVIDYPL